MPRDWDWDILIQPDVKPEGHEEDNLAEGITKHTAKKVPKGHLITCGSRFLSSAEHNYAVTELELTLIQWAVDKCRMYLAGTEFTAITDHQPLVGILNGKNLDAITNQRILRIVSKLIGYQCKLLWTPAQCPIQAYNATKSSSALWHDRIKFNELRYGKRGFAIFARSFR